MLCVPRAVAVLTLKQGCSTDRRQFECVLETEMFNSIVHAAWNLGRVRILEAALFDGTLDPLEDGQNEPKLARLTRYYRRFESTLLKCTRELRILQSNRASRAGSPEPIEATPVADPHIVARAKRTHWQSFTDNVRAELGFTDLMMARCSRRAFLECRQGSRLNSHQSC